MYTCHHKKEPSQHDKMNMLAEAEFDYKHMSLPDKLLIERYVKKVNGIAEKSQEQEKKVKK
jgi:hypothetical protein